MTLEGSKSTRDNSSNSNSPSRSTGDRFSSSKGLSSQMLWTLEGSKPIRDNSKSTRDNNSSSSNSSKNTGRSSRSWSKDSSRNARSSRNPRKTSRPASRRRTRRSLPNNTASHHFRSSTVRNRRSLGSERPFRFSRAPFFGVPHPRVLRVGDFALSFHIFKDASSCRVA